PRARHRRPRREARRPRGDAGRAGDRRREAPALPGARAARRLLRARAAVGHGGVPGPMIALANLLAFLGLLTALLAVWRQSRPGRLRLFAAQSALLAALAGTIALYSGHWRLLGVALAFAIIKVVLIPRAL